MPRCSGQSTRTIGSILACVDVLYPVGILRRACKQPHITKTRNRDDADELLHAYTPTPDDFPMSRTNEMMFMCLGTGLSAHRNRRAGTVWCVDGRQLIMKPYLDTAPEQ